MNRIIPLLLALLFAWAPAENLMDQAPLMATGGHWNAWKGAGVEATWGEAAPGVPSLKMTFSQVESGGAICRPITVKAGVKYTLTVKVRGRGNLTGHLFQYGADKKPAVKAMSELAKLTDAWTTVEREIAVSNGMETFTVNFLFYKQEGWFEISGLSLVPQPSPTGAVPRKTWPRGALEPVAWWTFDDGERDGSTVFDRMADQHGDLSEGVTLAPGRIGKALRFDGKRGSVLCDQAPLLSGAFTIGAWVKIENLADTWHTIYAGDSPGCPQLRVNPDGQLMLVRSDVKAVGGSTARLVPGDWNHVAVTFDPNGSFLFYMNGFPAGGGRNDDGAFVQAEKSSLGFVASGTVPRALKGDLDEVRVYDRVLPADEIKAWVGISSIPPVTTTAHRRPGTVELRLESSAEFNWWTLGTPVTFKPTGGLLPPEILSVTGTLADMDGKVVAAVKTSREDLDRNGWQWKAPTAGYFQLSFTFETARGTFTNRTGYSLITQKGTRKLFSRGFQSVVVMPPPGKPKAQFGFSYGSGLEEELAMARVFGFSFARWHFIAWGAHWGDEKRSVEPKRGEYRWDITDPHVALLKKEGYEIIGNVLFTPAWASPQPDDNSLGLGIPGKSVWAPKDMGDWTRFLTRLTDRYRADIKTWELWNEPNLPGGSVFWKDTPAKYAELLRTGYEAVKKSQPEATVWFGGMGGQRYLPFYREFLAAGGAPYDVLPMHGSWPQVDGFRALEKEFKVESKPWVSSEWHAVLVSAMAKPPTEAELAVRSVLDFSEQIRNGAGRIALFCLKEYGEKELLPVAYADGSFQQSAGLFRTRPRPEPRLAAVAIRTFMDQVERTIQFEGLADLGNDQHLLWFRDGAKLLGILWGEGSGAPVDPKVAPFLGACAITGLDGRSVESKGILLDPSHLYFLKGLPTAAVSGLTQSVAGLNPALRQKAVPAKVFGTWSTKPLFDESLKPLASGSAAAWNDRDWKWVGLTGQGKTEGYGARFAVSLTGKGLDLHVVVKDGAPIPSPKAGEPWMGDSLQFAIDTEGRSVAGAQSEFIVATDGNGGAFIQKTASANIGGDIPQKWTPAGRPIGFGKADVQVVGDEVHYRVRVELTELYPFRFGTDTRDVRLSFLVNQNDGKNRIGYLEWSSGIGSGKEPGAYGALRREP